MDSLTGACSVVMYLVGVIAAPNNYGCHEGQADHSQQPNYDSDRIVHSVTICTHLHIRPNV